MDGREKSVNLTLILDIQDFRQNKKDLEEIKGKSTITNSGLEEVDDSGERGEAAKRGGGISRNARNTRAAPVEANRSRGALKDRKREDIQSTKRSRRRSLISDSLHGKAAEKEPWHSSHK